MDLSYEETMRRIAQYEKEDPDWKCCKEKDMPYDVHVYQGENQMIVVPSIKSIGWYYVEMAWLRQIFEVGNAQVVGSTVMEALSYIEKSPVDARTAEERKADSKLRKATTCKTYQSFYRKYLLVKVHYCEDGTYVISPTKRAEKGGYIGSGGEKRVLAETATAMDIGSAIIQSFAKMEEADKTLKKCPPSKPRTTIELLSSSKLSFEELQDDHYVDEQDYHAAEIYQGYSYYKESPDDSVADLYYSIASELDCDISSDNIRKVYGALYGADAQVEVKEISHPVFGKRVEVIGKEIHHITYLKQIDESELLACELNLKIKPAGKRIYAKVLKDFEKMVESTRMEPV